MSDLQRNVTLIRARLHEAARRRGREEISLVAVTKTVSAVLIGEALKLGVRSFGENRLQEALPKVTLFPVADWHFIGRLQTNKAGEAAGRFSLIHSLDRWKLAEALQKHGEAKGLLIKVLVQVNVAGEEQKGGLAPEELTDFLAAVAGLSCLQVEGLMTVPPYEDNPEKTRPYFREMYRLFSTCRVPGVYMRILSMGMSDDYLVAVEEGANLVRLGSAVFGSRTNEGG
ncbi:MAG: YggS family pyridoxal phosphate-dependent enzyme [Firmicutes bacterium]|nr:YggS family pyridoxal phosphate-dependent enzyme [Bacillota bacterium]